jgi:hypothetical protein
VRVGGGLFGSNEAVEGVIPSAFAAVVGAIGASLWIGIGGILVELQVQSVFVGSWSRLL